MRVKMTIEPALNDDFRDLISALEKTGAEFLIVGGFAVSAYGYQRATKDLDIFIRPTRGNAERVSAALVAFGAPLFATTVDDLAVPGLILQLGVPPRRIDVINRIEGVGFDEAWAGHTTVWIGTLSVPIIGLDALIKNKLAVGRPEDIKDVRKLTELRKASKTR
jgi:predicted nucleotidyltransferase